MKGVKGTGVADKSGMIVQRIRLAQEGLARINEQLKAPVPVKHAKRPEAYRAMLNKDVLLLTNKVEKVKFQVVPSGSKK